MEHDTLKHLEFIQNVITRFNTYSFHIKGWAITIVAATLELYASTKEEYFVLVGIIPSFIFWFLDANYLTQEKRFRALYNDVASISEEPVVSNPKPFTLDISPYKTTEPFRKAFWSDTIKYLYLAIIAMLVVLFTCLMFIDINKGVCNG